MTLDPVRLVEHVHGHLGWLAAAMLVHPAVVLRSPSRRAHLAVGLSTGFVSLASAFGVVVYAAYRERLRREIFVASPALGLLMERKEHLAFAAVVLAWAGAAAYVAAGRAPEATRLRLRVAAFRAYACAAVLAIVVAVLGTTVAVFRSF